MMRHGYVLKKRVIRFLLSWKSWSVKSLKAI
jgi:hypothetical protein